MPSSSNDKLFWADRKNRLEKSRLDIVLKNMDKEQMYTAHDIEREKRALVKNLTQVRRTSGVSDQGIPPRDEKDTDYQNAPNYRMGLRLSERRLLEWRENEKQVEKFMYNSACELASAEHRYTRNSSTENHKLLKRASSAKLINPSTSSVSGYTEVKTLDDNALVNGNAHTPMLSQRSASMVDLNPKKLEKQIFSDYTDLIHKSRIPSTSDILKMKEIGHGKCGSDSKVDEKKRLRFRPQTASVTSNVKRKLIGAFPARPATAHSKLQTTGKKKRSSKTCHKRDTYKDEADMDNDELSGPLVNNFMSENSEQEESHQIDDVANSDEVFNETSESSSGTGGWSKALSPRSISNFMRDIMPEVETKFKGTYINSSVTIVYGDENGEVCERPDDTDDCHIHDIDTSDEEYIHETTAKNDVQHDVRGENYSFPNKDDCKSKVLVDAYPHNYENTADAIGHEVRKSVSSSRHMPPEHIHVPSDHGDVVDGRLLKSRRRVSSRALTGIAEDKVLNIEEGMSQEREATDRSNGDDTGSSATISSSSQLRSRQRRTSTTSTATHSDRHSGTYDSMSDIYSIGSDGQRRPSKWRQYVAADTAPVPQKKMVTVTAVVRAALAFSKLARKRALDQLVEEQSTDPVELIRKERLRRLHSRNNILQTITNSWSMKDENSLPSLQEQL